MSLSLSRRSMSRLGLALTLAGLTGLAAPAAQAQTLNLKLAGAGKVYTSSNAADGNALLVYARVAGGGLMLAGQVATGGLGLGAGLGSQGAVTLSQDGHYLFVVNAASNTVSTFELADGALNLRSVVATGGSLPISVAEHGGWVSVLNSGGDGNVSGFRNNDGVLSPVAGSVQGLSTTGGVAPAQVAFSDDGRALVVTEKGTNRLTSYSVHADGSLGPAQITASPGMTPFGFAFNGRNRMVVSEAVGGQAGASTVSSYRFGHRQPSLPKLVSASVPDTQSAACWVAIGKDGRTAYVTNTGSSSVSSYHVAGNGQIDLIAAVAGDTGSGSHPADAAVAGNGHHLYVRNGGSATLSSFRIGGDGSLGVEPLTGGLPASAVGLAAN